MRVAWRNPSNHYGNLCEYSQSFSYYLRRPWRVVRYFAGHQRHPFSQRHDVVGIAGSVPTATGQLRPGFCADRADYGRFQCSASLLQPLVGLYTDTRPLPWLLPAGMGFTVAGLILLSRADSYAAVVVVVVVGGADWRRFGGVSPRILAHCTYGFGGQAQIGAVDFSGRLLWASSLLRPFRPSSCMGWN